MDWWTKIRLEVLRGERSKREILRREGIHWETLKKILEHPEPPGYRMKHSRPRPKIGPYLEPIAQIIEEDKALPKKQRHTAKRIYERIKEMGYEGNYTQVKEAVQEVKRLRQEVFMPLVHHPGEAQVDFGHALAKVGGVSNFYYMSPYLIIDATINRIINDSFVVFLLLLITSLVLGRGFCGWFSPAAGCQEGIFLARKKRITKGDFAKWIIWIP